MGKQKRDKAESSRKEEGKSVEDLSEDRQENGGMTLEKEISARIDGKNSGKGLLQHPLAVALKIAILTLWFYEQ